MPKGYSVDDILGEYEAKRRPPKPPEPAGAASPPRPPFKLRSFADTAELLPKRLSPAARPGAGDTQVLPPPLAAPEVAGKGGKAARIAAALADGPGGEAPPPAVTAVLPPAAPSATEPEPEAKPPEVDEEENFMRLSGGPSRAERRAQREAAREAEREAPDALPPVDEEAAPALDEYTGPDDAEAIEQDFTALKTSLLIRLSVSLAGLVVLAWLALTAAFPGSVPGGELALAQPAFFAGANTGILALLCLVSHKVVFGGVAALVRLKATNDSPLAFAALASLGHGAVLLLNAAPLAGGAVPLYFACVAAGFFFNALGKLLMVARIAENFELVRGETACFVALDASLGARLGGRNAVLPVRARQVSDFLGFSYSDDLAESLSRVTAPIFLGFSLLAGLIAFLLFGDAALALTALAALTAMAAPFTATLCGSLPLYRAARALAPEGGAVCGYASLEAFEACDALIVDAGDLFPASSVELHGIKTFAEGRIDKAITDAAGVMCACGGLLSEVFLQVLGGRRDLLPEVSQIAYEDGRGLRALVEGEAAFIGGRELMRAHGIAAPSRDYEQKFVGDGNDLLYLAGAREVTAMFSVSYRHDPALAPLLARLTARGTALFVKTTDPNITPERVAEAYGLRPDAVHMLPAALAARLPDRAVQESLPAALIAGDTPAGRLRTVAAVPALRGAITAASAIQLIGMLLGYGLAAFFAFTQSLGAMGFVQVMAYQLFWALLTAAAAFIGKI